MKETKVYAKLRLNLDSWGECDRVENAVGSGMSDVFYNIEGKTGWIETKVEKKGGIYFEKFQPNWIAKHSRLGARMFVVVMLSDETLCFFRAHEVLRVPRTVVGRWQVVSLADVMPRIKMTKPYRRWSEVRELLIS